MCGIAGFISIPKNYTEKQLVSMTDLLTHRGTDASGYFFDGFCGLGHRRLSVLDLSDAGKQPMFSACGKYAIVFNGEVYNYKEVAQELNIVQKTGTDTEVLLEAFILKGPDFVNLLNGMFAFVIYKLDESKIWIFRDRVGIKPIYYFYDGLNFVFASELKAVKSLLEQNQTLKINKHAINSYLHLGYIEEPNSIYENISKFPSGHYAELSNNQSLKFTNYWNLFTKINDEIDSFEEAKDKLKYLLFSSVNYRLISDVPFGTFLSGGVDSSLVTAIAANISEKKINTFTIGFHDKSHSEAEYAAKISKSLGTDHHEMILSEKDSIQLLEDIVGVYDEPFADTSAIPTMLISKFARQHVTMTLAGDGGDELFMGYGAYQWAKRLQNPFLNAFKQPIGGFLSSLPQNKYKRAAMLFKYDNEANVMDHIFSQEQYLFSENELHTILKNKDTNLLTYGVPFSLVDKSLKPEEKQALFDFKYYLKDDLLVKVDRASMKYSLETRVPLLDYRIVEYSFGLPIDYKLKNGESKHILKSILYDYVPQELFNRPKRGFSIPLVKWLKNDLGYLIEDYTNTQIINKYDILDSDAVQLLVKQFLAGHDYLYNRVWLVIHLHMWLSKNA